VTARALLLLASCHVGGDKKKRPKYYQLFGEPRQLHSSSSPVRPQSYCVATLEGVGRFTDESIGGLCEESITTAGCRVLGSSIICRRNILVINVVEHSFSFITIVFSLSFSVGSGEHEVDSPSLGGDGAVREGLGSQLLAHPDKRDPVDLDDVVVDLDPTVVASQGLIHDLLDVDVKLVLHPVDHVDPDHADAEAGGGRNVVVDDQVHLHHLHVRYLFFQFIFNSGVKELRARYGVASVVVLRTVSLPDSRGPTGETETAGGLVESLLPSNLGDNDVQVVALIVSADVFVKTEDVGELVF